MIMTPKRTVGCALFICLFGFVHAQDQATAGSSQVQTASTPAQEQSLPESDSAIAKRQALKFADSLLKANFYTEWPTYMSLTCPSAIKYYGGKSGFQEHVVTMRYRNETQPGERPEKTAMVTLMNNVDTWQCVIEKSRETFSEDRGRAIKHSYLVGESTDNGLTWKFIDVSYNTIENVINIMPTIFGNLPIPEAKTVYPDEVAAQEAPQPAVKKKPIAKKHAR
jgi:hypothetical protein